MNELNMPPNIKRMPLWGLGCAGGAAGLSCADDYCRAYPDANVLVLCLELCSLTFVRGDKSKRNLIGTSLFSDGAAEILALPLIFRAWKTALFFTIANALLLFFVRIPAEERALEMLG